MHIVVGILQCFIILPGNCVLFMHGILTKTHIKQAVGLPTKTRRQDAATLEAKRQRMARQIERRRQALILGPTPWESSFGLPSRGTITGIPPWGSWENHRLKYAIFLGDMLVPWRVFWVNPPGKFNIDTRNDGPWKMYLRLQTWLFFLSDARGAKKP